MSLLEKLMGIFRKKETPSVQPVSVTAKPAAASAAAPAAEKPRRLQKACRECGKLFSYDPGWEHIPNFCKECRQKFAKEREEKQRAGAPRKIRRTCRQCGKVFTFPNTLEHYPNYCGNCRKQHQAAMKAKYSGKKA